MPDPATGVVLVSISDFGWGSLGKLRLILDRLGTVPLMLDEQAGGTPTVRALLGDRYLFVTDRDADVACALVINDPAAADRITATGTPVVYVDSLPYLWATPQEVPAQVAVYCAQRFPTGAASLAPPLAGRSIHWIDPIVPRARRWRGGGGAVVNVGGLHSHLSGDATGAYLDLVLPPLVEALRDSGRPVAAVCGNLPEPVCARLRAELPGTAHIGRQSPPAFEEILSTADVLFTSPGSTTLLQAAALGLPTVLLPPQNLSQILNAEIYSSDRTLTVTWPASVLDRDTIESLRPRGEDAVLEYIYPAIVAASRSPAERAAVASTVRDVVARSATGDSPLSEHLATIGVDGASQVARILRQAVLAPMPVPAPSHPSDPSPGRQVRGV